MGILPLPPPCPRMTVSIIIISQFPFPFDPYCCCSSRKPSLSRKKKKAKVSAASRGCKGAEWLSPLKEKIFPWSFLFCFGSIGEGGLKGCCRHSTATADGGELYQGRLQLSQLRRLQHDGHPHVLHLPLLHRVPHLHPHLLPHHPVGLGVRLP